MSTLTSWNQLQIVTPEPLAGSGGQALNDNFKMLSTNMTNSNPGTGDDNTQGYGAGSVWYNTTTNTAFICTDAATGAARIAAISSPEIPCGMRVTINVG